MWNKIFNVQNPFWQSMGTIFDLFILNTLWLVFCIPVVTIGPSTTAVCYALIQRARREDVTVSKDFFRSFKLNLRQGILLGLPLTLLGAFLAFDVYICRVSGKGIFTFFMVFFAIIFVFWAFTTLYTFPILSKFERKNTEILIWAFTLSIKNLGMTLIMLFVIIAGIWSIHILPGLIFIVPGMAAQFCATIFASIFKPYLPKPFWAEEGTGGSSDGWYSANGKPADSGSESPGTSAGTGYQDQGTSAGPGLTATGDRIPDSTYADFDEAAFYGENPEEVRKLLESYEENGETHE